MVFISQIYITGSHRKHNCDLYGLVPAGHLLSLQLESRHAEEVRRDHESLKKQLEIRITAAAACAALKASG